MLLESKGNGYIAVEDFPFDFGGGPMVGENMYIVVRRVEQTMRCEEVQGRER